MLFVFRTQEECREQNRECGDMLGWAELVRQWNAMMPCEGIVTLFHRERGDH